ncbi:sulfite exporter TauE/SafE family protein [Actinopolyspora erythraea]|uniref:Probable membrane transporter protein n=1 Tax=Actinopolyspora erythraea TaxID=414996 RepID=A0A223RYQ0_9ACTN|nr:sulfite exporter TauE/SafE family protein [Actinopolyspora erythraea]ASU81012.1 sulfite exporter TauE/SafE family protein [Actinopolyspora erythraea]
MPTLLLVAVAGFLAQLVDGSLGMGFGVTATTGLLAVGTAPVMASASVHLAKIGTAVVSGAAHWRMRNVDWRMVGWLALPGGIGGFLGASALSSIAAGAARGWMALLLVVLGSYVVLRFSAWSTPVRGSGLTPAGRRWLIPLGGIGGFVDSVGGGGWGPVTTSTLLSTGRILPRRTVGTVNTSELIVSLGATCGFLLHTGGSAWKWPVTLGLLMGGVVAAPLAAWLVRILPVRVLGVGAGGLIVFSNSRLLLDSVGVPSLPGVLLTALLGAAWLTGLTWAIRAEIRQRRSARSGASEVGAPGYAYEVR